MPKADVYPFGLVKRLLEHWPELAEGRWPATPGTPQGYRGRRHAEVGGFEVAIDAYVDLCQAVDRLTPELRVAVRRRYWEDRPTVYPWSVLVEAVWLAL